MAPLIKNIKVPTGNILIVKGESGKLECLSIGDYGKNVNLKCDAMGLNRKPEPVKHTQMLPLTEKWVITISTQYGCSMGCSFCDVPIVGNGRNASHLDMIMQIKEAMKMHPEITWTKRLNVHYARMGEPTWNPSVIYNAMWLKYNINTTHKVHPVVSTMMPVNNKHLKQFIHDWMYIKNYSYKGNAGLQLSINSTNEYERTKMFGGSAHTLSGISDIMRNIIPVGRKITLNFALADYEIDPDILLSHFSPEKYIVKLTPMHKTTTAIKAGIKTDGNYTEYTPYENTETKLKKAGYDVLVFIASSDEDKSRITCGNAILADLHNK